MNFFWVMVVAGNSHLNIAFAAHIFTSVLFMPGFCCLENLAVLKWLEVQHFVCSVGVQHDQFDLCAYPMCTVVADIKFTSLCVNSTFKTVMQEFELFSFPPKRNDHGKSVCIDLRRRLGKPFRSHRSHRQHHSLQWTISTMMN